MRCSWWWRIVSISTPIQVNNPTKPGKVPGFVVLIAPVGSYRITSYVNAAESLGIGLLVVSNSKYALIPAVANGITVDFSNLSQALSKILSAIETFNIVCVIATDDSCVELSNLVAGHLDLPHNSTTATRLTHRKDLARQALRMAGCHTPEFQLIRLDKLPEVSLEIPYPVVIKPLSLSGSRGVIRVDNQKQFDSACNRIDAILEDAAQTGFVREWLLVESYLDGPEFAVEGFLINGNFHLLTIFDKPEPLAGPFFEETYYLTPSQLDNNRKQALITEVSNCCAAYNLIQGPVHAEARITESGAVLLELAARTIGGQCGQLIEFSMRQKLEELVIQGMSGHLPVLPEKSEAAGVLMIPITGSGLLKRVEGLTEAMQVEFIKDVEIHIREGYELVPLPEGSSYLGFIFAQAPSYKETYDALKASYQKLQFITQPIWKLDQLEGQV